MLFEQEKTCTLEDIWIKKRLLEDVDSSGKALCTVGIKKFPFNPYYRNPFKKTGQRMGVERQLKGQ